jgi:hypothetical protein
MIKELLCAGFVFYLHPTQVGSQKDEKQIIVAAKDCKRLFNGCLQTIYKDEVGNYSSTCTVPLSKEEQDRKDRREKDIKELQELLFGGKK